MSNETETTDEMITALKSFKQDRKNPAILPHKQALLKVGLSQSHVADLLGYTQPYVCSVLNGSIVSHKFCERLTEVIEQHAFLLND